MAGDAHPQTQNMQQTPLAAIWRYRWLVLTLTLLSGAVALLLAIGLLPAKYEAKGSLVVTDPRATTLFSAADATGNDAERYVADQKAILGSDIVAQRASELVATALPGTVINPRKIVEDIGISTSSSNEIKLKYAAEDEETAITMVNSIMAAYEQLRAESAARDSASAIEQLDQSIADIDTELADLQLQIIDVRENPVWLELDRQYEAALSRLAVIQPQLATAEGDSLLALQAELVAIDQQLQRLNGIVRLADSQQTAIQFNATQRNALDDQYDEAINRLAEIQPLLSTAEGNALIALQAEMADIDKQLARLTGIIQIAESDPRLIQLNQEQAEANTRRRALAEERDRLLIDTQLLSGGITLSSPAQFAEEVRTDIAITILGAALGFLAAAGLAYLLAMNRRKFIERAQPGWVLRSELLAEVPNFAEDGVKSDTPVIDHPASVTAEAFRFAATTLDLQLTEHQFDGRTEDTPVHTFLVTSASPGDGKTVLVTNLALAAARKGRSVLVIDADFGFQRLTELLRGSTSNGPGITEVVEAGFDLDTALVHLEQTGNLDLLSRGQRNVTAPDFFSLPATKAFINKIGDYYDLVLIDGPPMLHIAYASTLATYVDRVVTVVKHGSAIKQLEDLSQRLDLIGTPLAGYVYNAAPLRYEMTLTEGSLKDVLGQDLASDVPPTSKRKARK